MKAKRFVISIGCLGIAVLSAGVCPGTTIYVDDDNTSGPWDGTIEHPYQHIQNGVDAASSGDTVYVFNGTHYENVVVNKSIDLTGENKNNTIVHGGGSGDVVNISVDSVVITGFSIQNGDYGVRSSSDCIIISENNITNATHYGAYLYDSFNSSISGNDFMNNDIGIYLDHSFNNVVSQNLVTENSTGIVMIWFGSGNTVTHNLVTANGQGITLDYASDHIVSDNIISANDNHGLYLGEVLESTIAGNIIRENGGDGIRLRHLLYIQPYDNLISENNIEDNGGDGIHFYYARDNTISWNHITGNTRSGIYYDLSCDNNVIFKNHIANNIETGIYLESSSSNNTIYHNNFISNNPNAYDEGTNTWDDGYPSGGNHWDDYTGSDHFSGPNQSIPGSDGIGDAPYDILGGSNQDRYPLMNPYSVLFVRADANADMKIQMGDATNILLYLYVPGSPALVCMDAGDANDDGAITMNDALYILQYLYVPGSPEPQAPFPDCGFDPTEDGLVCLTHPCMEQR